MKKSVTLVFDIGKTTKKALVFDREFHVVEEKTETFSEIQDAEGFPMEDLQRVSDWTKEIVRSCLSDPRYDVTHLNFSAYGASLVNIGNNRPILPFINYLKPCPDELKEKFFSLHSVDDSFFPTTASPWLGFLNSGVQAFWMKHCRPEIFGNIKAILHFPQFFPFLLTGKMFSEKTSLGCHTLLWDFSMRDYASWVKKENIHSLFPDILPSDYRTDHFIHDHLLKVGIGVHDSSAALMPYLVSRTEPFLLLSTGTWNICFNPFNHEALTDHELKHDCLCYLTYRGAPVKASRIFLGHEHEIQQQQLAKHFNVDPNHYKSISFNENVYKRLKEQADTKKRFFPLSMTGTGPLPESSTEKTDYNAFADFEEAQHQLMIDLSRWQGLSIDLVDPGNQIRDIILVGGFTRSPLFLNILKREITSHKFFLSDHPRASGLGAAWLVHDPQTCRDNASLLKVSAL